MWLSSVCGSDMLKTAVQYGVEYSTFPASRILSWTISVWSIVIALLLVSTYTAFKTVAQHCQVSIV